MEWNDIELLRCLLMPTKPPWRSGVRCFRHFYWQLSSGSPYARRFSITYRLRRLLSALVGSESMTGRRYTNTNSSLMQVDPTEAEGLSGVGSILRQPERG